MPHYKAPAFEKHSMKTEERGTPWVSDELLSEIKGNIGWITLNRPKVLNALSLNMIRKFSRILKEWESLPFLKAVLVQGVGDRAFCAGGDVRAVYEAKRAGNLEDCKALFREEYALNAQIYSFKKPYISLINGIAMGGGLGISAHGTYRIVTEKALLAMPETGIGFFPDAGASTFLNKAPGTVGLYLGLTGAHLRAEDALWTGFATHFVPSSSLSLFATALLDGDTIEEGLKLYCKNPPTRSLLESHAQQIETHFNQPTLEDIFQSLTKDNSPFAQQTYKTLQKKSPTSLAVTFRQLKKEAPHLSFKERMELECHLSQHFIQGHDFSEGVRAVLVDKDHMPRWDPASIKDLKQESINKYFFSAGKKACVF